MQTGFWLTNTYRSSLWVHKWKFYKLQTHTEQSVYEKLDFCGSSPLTSSAEITIQQIDVSFLCICPVFDHKFPHHIVKVAVDPRGDSRVDPQTTLTMLWRNSLSITGQTHYWKTDINLFFMITNCRISRSRSLTRRTNFKFMCLSAYWQ